MQNFCIKCFSFLHFSAWKSFIGLDTDTCTYRTGAILFLPCRWVFLSYRRSFRFSPLGCMPFRWLHGSGTQSNHFVSRCCRCGLAYSFGGAICQYQYSSKWDQAERELRNIANGVREGEQQRNRGLRR